MREIFRACVNEYRNIFSDFGVMLIFIGAIVFYSVFYPMPYYKEVLKEVPVAVVDLGNSLMSRRLVRMFDASEMVRVAEKPATFADAKKYYTDGTVRGIIVIPADFRKKVLKGEQAVISTYCDTSYFLIYKQLYSGIMRSARTMSAGIEVRRLQAAGMTREEALAARDPLPLVSYALFNPAGGYASYIVPAAFVLILQQTLLIGIGMLGGTMRERKAGYYFIVSKAGAGSVVPVIAGKGLAYLSLYLVHAVYYFGFMFRIYKYPMRGEPLDMFLFLLPFLISVILLGLTISPLFRQRETAIVALLFTTIPAVFLCGFSWPVQCLPEWIRILSRVLPTTTGIDGFMRITVMGATLRDVREYWLFLWGLTAVYFVTACLALRYIEWRGAAAPDISRY